VSSVSPVVKIFSFTNYQPLGRSRHFAAWRSSSIIKVSMGT
jgi:hypothetical protein